MLIEFKIQLSGTGTAGVTAAEAAANPSAASQKQLGTVFVAPAAGQKGGSAPVGDPGGGTPTGGSPGSGPVFVIGPIIICPASAPVGDPGGGPPAGNNTAGV
jgi:hypothetical protein